jgi:hypothetical protein
MTRPRNRAPLFVAIAVMSVVAGLTWWQRPPAQGETTTQGGSDPGLESSPQESGGSEPPNAAPPLRDVWAGRAPVPAGDRKLGTRLGGTAEERERAAGEYARLAADLERTHSQQPVDAAWKARAERELEQVARDGALEKAALAARALQTDCRSSSCRVSASFDSRSNAEDWALLFSTMTGSQFRAARYVTVQADDGSVQLRLYGQRR